MPDLYCQIDECPAWADHKVTDNGHIVLTLCSFCADAYRLGQAYPDDFCEELEFAEYCETPDCGDEAITCVVINGELVHLCATHRTAFQWGKVRPEAAVEVIEDSDIDGWDDDPLAGEWCRWCGKTIFPNTGATTDWGPHHGHCVKEREGASPILHAA